MRMISLVHSRSSQKFGLLGRLKIAGRDVLRLTKRLKSTLFDQLFHCRRKSEDYYERY
jgi:hypothetical protein